MSKRKIIITVSIVLVAVTAVALSVFLRKPHRDKQDMESKAVGTSTQSTSALSEEESGDSFNTDDLDTGIAKEGRSTGGLAHGVDETEASTEASEPETYAETDADGKNLTEPAQIIPTVEQGLSASEYGQIAESVQQQNNEAITDTSSDGSVGKDVNDAISAIQDAELEEAKRLVASPEFQAYFESVHAND